jgi:hypothetical protein
VRGPRFSGLQSPRPHSPRFTVANTPFEVHALKTTKNHHRCQLDPMFRGTIPQLAAIGDFRVDFRAQLRFPVNWTALFDEERKLTLTRNRCRA